MSEGAVFACMITCRISRMTFDQWLCVTPKTLTECRPCYVSYASCTSGISHRACMYTGAAEAAGTFHLGSLGVCLGHRDAWLWTRIASMGVQHHGPSLSISTHSYPFSGFSVLHPCKGTRTWKRTRQRATPNEWMNASDEVGFATFSVSSNENEAVLPWRLFALPAILFAFFLGIRFPFQIARVVCSG